MSRRAADWAWAQKRISATAKLVLLDLSDRADMIGRAWPSIPNIAARCSLSERAVQNALRELSEAYLITVQSRRKGARSTSNLYTIAYSEASPSEAADAPDAPPDEPHEGGAEYAPRGAQYAPGGVQQVHPRGAPDSPIGVQQVHPESSNIEPPNRTSTSLRSVPRARGADAFETFWQVFPRKVGKAAARKAWAVALRKASVAEIAAGLNAQVASGALDAGGFTPHPATWLNQGRWQDDPHAGANVAPRREEVRNGWVQCAEESGLLADLADMARARVQ